MTFGRFFPRLAVLPNPRTVFKPVNAIFARHMAPVVRQSKDGERAIVLMSWGFLRLVKARAPDPVTNIRGDQIKAKPFRRDRFAEATLARAASSLCQPNDTCAGAAALVRDPAAALCLSGVWRRCRVIRQVYVITPGSALKVIPALSASAMDKHIGQGCQHQGCRHQDKGDGSTEWPIVEAKLPKNQWSHHLELWAAK
jgi:hypothetical protein